MVPIIFPSRVVFLPPWAFFCLFSDWGGETRHNKSTIASWSSLSPLWSILDGLVFAHIITMEKGGILLAIIVVATT